MGQKSHPVGLRLGINRTWDSRWFGGRAYAELLHQDIGLRKYLFDKLIVKEAYVGKGLVMKRFHARARGRGAKIIKPFSHLTILLSEQEGK